MYLLNEHVIIMDERANPLTAGEFKMLAGAGVRTVYLQAAVQWDEMQADPGARLAFDWLDERMEAVTGAGLRALVPFLNRLPQWLPDSFYFTRKDNGIPNYASQRMGELLDDLARAIIARYPPAQFQLIYGMPGDGEFPVEFWPYTNTLPFPTQVLSDWAIARHKVLEPQHGEVWTAFHCYTQPAWFDEFYTALSAAYPHSQHYAIAFTHFVHNRQVQKDRLAYNRDHYGMKYFAGSEYVQGFKTSLPALKAEGVWGFITAPIHSFQQHKRLEGWQLSEIERVIGELGRA